MSQWRTIKLGEVIKLQRGYDLTEKNRNKGDVPIYGSAGIHGYHDTVKVKEPGVVIGRSGASFGVAHYCSNDYWPHNTVLFVTDFCGNNPKYVYFLLKNLDFTKLNSGSAQASLNRNYVYILPVYVPYFSVQVKIAVILSSYDDLIENNLRRIKILEEMAQNLYREWFVNFRFPGHEKTRFIDSPLGRIPEGWEVLEFRNLFDIKYGKTLPKTKISKHGLYPVYGAGDIIGYYDEMICEKKCVLVTSRGNGSGTVWRTRGAAFITNNSLIIKPKPCFNHWGYTFIELLLKNSNVMEAKTGSAQPQVTIENLNYVKGLVPESKCVERFCAITLPIYELIDRYLIKNYILCQTRDLLLPKIVSGEVDVSELDINVSEEEAV